MRKKEIRKLFKQDAERFKLTPQKYQEMIENMELTRNNEEIRFVQRGPKLKLLMSCIVIILLTMSLTVMMTVSVYDSYRNQDSYYHEKYIKEGNVFLNTYCDTVQANPMLASDIDSDYFINIFCGKNSDDKNYKYAIQFYRKINTNTIVNVKVQVSNDLKNQQVDFSLSKEKDSFISLLNTPNFTIISNDILEFKIYIDDVQSFYFSFIAK